MTLREELLQAVNAHLFEQVSPLLQRAADYIGGLEDLNKKAEQYCLDAFERGRQIGYADGMMNRMAQEK